MPLDLYDEEMAKAAQVFAKLNYMGVNTSNSQSNLKEFGKRIKDEFYKVGLVVQVDMSACGMINPKTGRFYPPDVEVVARLSDPHNQKETDHDRKRFEIVDAKAKGEKFRGEKIAVNKPRKKSG